MTIKIIVEKREKYDSNEDNNINNNVENEYHEGLEAGRRQKHVKKRVTIKLNDDNIKKTLINAFIKKKKRLRLLKSSKTRFLKILTRLHKTFYEIILIKRKYLFKRLINYKR